MMFRMPRQPKTYRARKLRQQANAPEQVAWQTLRALRAYGFPVKRQYAIGPYIVDFAIFRAKLVIEVDGGIHDREAVAQHDAMRQREIEAMGWRVVRFSSEEAMSADTLWGRMTELLGL